MKTSELYKSKDRCCGCSNCYNICPRNAISMNSDEYGIDYPNINEELCISCGLCKSVCIYNNESIRKDTEIVYAASSRNDKDIKESTSGGAFFIIAKQFIKNGGVVYGCEMGKNNDICSPSHIRVSNINDLRKLRGSKYSQSVLSECFKKIKRDLISDLKVLFSGTPCQVAALYKYLQKTKIDNLYTIDIICHGVPGTKFFENYISFLEAKIGGSISNFIFRDKTEGWGLRGKIEYIDKKGENKTKIIPLQFSSYYASFINSDTYRDSCYSCDFADRSRVSDLTLGDYWNIEKEHPEYLISNGGNLDINLGISCILVNGDKGQQLLNESNDNLYLYTSSFEKVSKHNHQLISPSIPGEYREKYKEAYKDGGYKAFDKLYYEILGSKKLLYKIWNIIPLKIRRKIKR